MGYWWWKGSMHLWGQWVTSTASHLESRCNCHCLLWLYCSLVKWSWAGVQRPWKRSLTGGVTQSGKDRWTMLHSIFCQSDKKYKDGHLRGTLKPMGQSSRLLLRNLLFLTSTLLEDIWLGFKRIVVALPRIFYVLQDTNNMAVHSGASKRVYVCRTVARLEAFPFRIVAVN